MPIKMQIDKASSFQQLAKFPDDLPVATAIMPSLAASESQTVPHIRQDLPPHTHTHIHANTLQEGRNFQAGQQRYQHVPLINTGNAFFSGGNCHNTELEPSSKQMTDGSRHIR